MLREVVSARGVRPKKMLKKFLRLFSRSIKCPTCGYKIPLGRRQGQLRKSVRLVSCLKCDEEIVIIGDKARKADVVRAAQIASKQFEEDFWKGLIGDE